MYRIYCYLFFVGLLLHGAASAAEVKWAAPVEVSTVTTGPASRIVSPQLATGPGGNLMAVYLAGRYYDGFNDRIISTFSTDSGDTWTSGVTVNNAEVLEDDDWLRYRRVLDAHLIYAGDGVWLCQSMNKQLNSGTAFSINSAISEDNGNTWNNAGSRFSGRDTSDNLTNKLDTGIDIATDGLGRILATWVEYGSGYRHLIARAYYSVDYGRTWLNIARMHDASLAIKESYISCSNGKWYHGFSAYDIDTDQVAVEAAVSTDTVNWRRHRLHTHTGGISTPTLGDIHSSGSSVVLAYSSYLRPTGGAPATQKAMIQYSLDSGENWSGPVLLGDLYGDAYYKISTDSSGQWIITATTAHDASSPGASIAFYSTSDLATSWTKVVCPSPAGLSAGPGPADIIETSTGVCLAVSPYYAIADKQKTLVNTIKYTPENNQASYADFPGNQVTLKRPSKKDPFLDLEAGENGSMVMCWANDYDSSYEVHVARSDDYGQSWQTRPPLVRDTASFERPKLGRINYNGIGRWMISTEYYRGYPTYMALSPDDGMSWTTSTYGIAGARAVDGKGTVVRENMNRSTGDGFLIRSRDGGFTWDTPVSADIYGVSKVVYAADSTWYVLSNSYNALDAKSTDNAQTWTMTSTAPPVEDVMESDGQGTVIGLRARYSEVPYSKNSRMKITMRGFSESIGTIFQESTLDEYVFSTIFAHLHPHHSQPSLASIGGNQWVAVWDKPYIEPPANQVEHLADSRIFYSVSADGGYTWSSPARLTPEEEIPAGEGQLAPVVAGRDGQVWVAWKRYYEDNRLEQFPQLLVSKGQIHTSAHDWQLYQ